MRLFTVTAPGLRGTIVGWTHGAAKMAHGSDMRVAQILSR